MENFLKKISFIKDVKELKASDFSGRIENIEFRNKVIKNAKRISAYSFLYKSNKRWIKGYIVIPKKFNILNKYPCVLVNRGGTRDFGSIKPGLLFAEYFSWPVLCGGIVITTNFHQEEKMGDAQDIKDVLRLYDILKKIPEANLDNIGLFGWSRGGQTVYQVLRQKPSWVKYGILIAGPTDQIRQIVWREGWKEHCDLIFGTSIEDLKFRSALYWAEEIKPVPLLIIHGTKDVQVNVQDSIDLYKKLPYATLKLYENDDHSLTINKDKTKRLVLEWFKKAFNNLLITRKP